MLHRNRIFMTCNLIKPKHVSEFLNEIQKIYLQKISFLYFIILEEMLHLTQNNNTILKHLSYVCSKETKK